MNHKAFPLFRCAQLRHRILTSRNTLYLLFPDDSPSLAYYALLYADAYREEIGAGDIGIITDNPLLCDAASLMVKSSRQVYALRHAEMQRLLRGLSYHIDLMGAATVRHLYYISAFYPYGESGQILLREGVFHASYYVWNRIFHAGTCYVGDAPSCTPAVYCGDHAALANFMRIGEQPWNSIIS